MDIFYGLVNQSPEKDFGRPGWRKVIIPEDLILPGANFIDFEVVGETEGLFNGANGSSIVIDKEQLSQFIEDFIVIAEGSEMAIGQ